jgi:eukaryotic-like serine/threonine-protein kinase
MPQAINRETVSGEALFILKNLKENGRLGRSNKLADVKAALEPSVSLEFDSYFFFLRKFHYIAMDREAQLKLTDQGESVVEGDHLDKFASEVGEFFQDQISMPDVDHTQAMELPESDMTDPGRTLSGSASSVSSDYNSQESDVANQPPSSRRSKMSPPPPPTPEEPLATSAPASTSRVDVPDLKRDNPPTPVPVLTTPGTPPMTSNPGKGNELDVRYVKFDAIGSGPLGTVFKGRHNALGLDTCVKELKDIFGYFSFLQRSEVIKRLKKELCAQAQVRHPSVVAVLDQNTDVARPFFVMELLRGSLKEKLDQAGGKGIPVPLAIRYFLQLAYGLKSAHAQGLTHHNIKPENVLFDSYGNAKVGDFGLSRVVEVDPSKGMPQVFVGTGGMAYMAPELIGRAKDAGGAADVYSVGILFYEMLTGQIPGRRSPLPSEVNGEIPSKLDPIFDKMTQDRREARYPDFDAMLQDFYGAFSEGEYLGRGDLVLWSEAPRT